MTRNVIKGEHGEDADGRGQGLEDGLVSCRETQSRAEAGVTGLAPQASGNGLAVPAAHETDGGTGGSRGLQGHKTDPRSHGWSLERVRIIPPTG